MRIPFNKPFVVGKELFYIAQALSSGHLAGDGGFTRKCHARLEDLLGARCALLTTSATHALELAALLCDFEPGDEVVMPSYTFVSTANAFVLRGATPVFVDVEEESLNIDAKLIEGALSQRTKAIVPVHYGGVACDMETIMGLAKERGLRVIEDASQALRASSGGRSLGTIGDLGCISFHETKNCIAGEAGALLVNDESLIARAEILREKGTNRSQFFRGQVDKYTWLDIGSSYLPSELVAAFLFAQLEGVSRIQELREGVYQRYAEGLVDLEQAGKIRLPANPYAGRHNSHIFYVVCEDAQTRTKLMRFLRQRGIQAPFHYVPLHLSPMGQKHGRLGSSMERTESLWERILRLPLYPELSLRDQIEVISSLHEFYRC
ncbi:MAG: dTDP-4-amino-4,6-dideoxygalactose transaminase [Planctomycetota bacterium]|nr:MAG: dTDP-4-amino-4,6-dideoxygalactose transaminase [Planctomycetota bacterium]